MLVLAEERKKDALLKNRKRSSSIQSIVSNLTFAMSAYMTSWSHTLSPIFKSCVIVIIYPLY